jgi:hypothetical protein
MLDEQLRGFERANRLRATEKDAEAEAHRDEADKADKRYDGSNDAGKAAQAAHRKRYLGKAAAAETAAAVHRRRADHAAEGVLLHSPDERRDSGYMRANQALYMAANRAGRLRVSSEGLGEGRPG